MCALSDMITIHILEHTHTHTLYTTTTTTYSAIAQSVTGSVLRAIVQIIGEPLVFVIRCGLGALNPNTHTRWTQKKRNRKTCDVVRSTSTHPGGSEGAQNRILIVFITPHVYILLGYIILYKVHTYIYTYMWFRMYQRVYNKIVIDPNHWQSMNILCLDAVYYETMGNYKKLQSLLQSFFYILFYDFIYLSAINTNKIYGQVASISMYSVR